MYWSGHPLERYAEDLKGLGAFSLANLAGDDTAIGPRTMDVAVGGVIASIRPLKTKKGERMAVFVLEDPHGTIETVVFPELFGKAGSVVKPDAMVLVRGRLERDEESARLIATEVIGLDAACEQATRELAVHLSVPPLDRKAFETLAGVLASHRGDCRVSFEVEVVAESRPLLVRVAPAGELRVRPSSALVTAIERICGHGSVTLR
jgi:DNA polymerase-3 subunit alpha